MKWYRSGKRLAYPVMCLTIGILLTSSIQTSAQTWRFVVTCDSRGSSESDQINETILGEIIQATLNESPDFMLYVGDLVYGPGNAARLRAWTNVMAPIYDTGIAVYPVRGNHDVGGGWIQVFGNDLPDNGPVGETDRTYWVTHKNALIIGLDQYVNSHRVNQPWLDGVLAGNTLPHVFAFGHEPAFKANHSDCLDDYPTSRNAFWISLENAGARIYFAGHDHFYNHTRIDDGDGNPYNDMHQYIVGTAGAPFHNTPVHNGNNSTWTPVPAGHREAFGYVVVEIDNYNVTLTWKRRISPGVYQADDTFSYNAARMWQNATDLGNRWRNVDWFGSFYIGTFPWIYHTEHDWVYCSGENTANIWFWMSGLNWLWTSESLYPYLYRSNDGHWLWYQEGTSSPRRFYNLNTTSWETY